MQEVVVKHFVKREAAVAAFARAAVGKAAQHHAGQTLEDPRVAQRREHAVDAVDGFVDVFKRQDRAVEGWPVARARHRRHHRQVAAHQRPAGTAGAQRGGAARRVHQQLGLLGHVAQRADLRVHHHRAQGVDAEGVPFREAQRRVEGDEAGACVHGIDERGEVGVAAQEFGVTADQIKVHLRQHARAARAAGQGQDAVHAGVGKHGVDVGRALRVGAAIRAPARAQVGCFAHRKAQRLQRLGGAAVGLTLKDGVRRVDECHGVARAQALGAQQGQADCRFGCGHRMQRFQ